MSKKLVSQHDKDDDMLPEYDFSQGRRGTHYQAYRRGRAVLVHKANGTTEIRLGLPSTNPLPPIELVDLDPTYYVAIWQRAYHIAQQGRSTLPVLAHGLELDASTVSRAPSVQGIRATESSWSIASAVPKPRYLQESNLGFEYQEFAEAWTGLAFRTRAFRDHYETVRDTFERHRAHSDGEWLFRQDEASFGFVLACLSSVECLCYGLYAFGAMVNPQAFPQLAARASGRLESATLKATLKAFERAYPRDDITEQLRSISHDVNYRQLTRARNVLMHRSVYALPIGPDQSPNTRESAQWDMIESGGLWAGNLSIPPNALVAVYEWQRHAIDQLILRADTWTRRVAHD